MKKFAVFKRLLPHLRLHSWTLPTIITLGFLSSLAEGIGISLFIPFLQSVNQTSNDLNTGIWLVDTLGELFNHISPDYRLLILCVCIFGSVLLRCSLSYGSRVLFAWLDTSVAHRMRSALFEQFLTVSYRFLQSAPSGKLMNALENETSHTSWALSFLVDSITISFTLVVYITLLLLISWRMTLLVTVVMLVISFVVQLLTQRVRTLGMRRKEADASLSFRILEGLGGMEVIRTLGREPYEQQRFDQTSEGASKARMQIKIIREAVDPIDEILAAIVLVSILFSTLQTPGNLAAVLVFIFLLFRLQPKVKNLHEARADFNSYAAAVEEVTSLLDRTDKPYLHSGPIIYQGLKQAISFDRVTFRYDPTERPALENISIRIPANKTTAIVGPSGVGKSTLINLILRLYDVTAGEIFVDDHPLRELDLASWRSRIAVVSQDVYIFNTTVRENIGYGRLDATEDEIVAAAKQADAHEFISQLPEGYDTKVGDRGVRLSGGQQQRISLARAIVRDPEILILDEATNALDTISERLVQERLDVLRQNCTVIVIAHRLSTIERADHIIVLEDGRVREEGNLQHLLKLNGLFARLYELQYSRTVET